MPFFSIIIPTYNSSSHIQTVLKSILKQTNQDFEILIMDGMSGDDTIAKIQDFSSDKIRISSKKDNGIYDAMNSGIRIASGKWLYFLGSDDKLHDENVLSRIQQVIDESDIDVLYGNVLRSSKNDIYDGEFHKLSLLTKNISHQAIFFRRDLFEQFGFFNLKYKLLADWDFNLKWFLSPLVKKLYLNIVVAVYSDGGLSSTIIDEIFLKDLKENFYKASKNVKLPENARVGLLRDISISKRRENNFLEFWSYKLKFWLCKFSGS